MRRFIVGILAAAAIAIGGIVALAPAPSAQAAYNVGCVTRAEWRNVHNGMSMYRVHRILGTTGKVEQRWGFGVITRKYRACVHPRWSYLGIVYSDGRVNSKAGFFG